MVKLPRAVYSHLGPVPVSRTDLDDDHENTMGYWADHEREIVIRDTLHPAAALATLCHEITHVAMMDAGAQYGFSHDEKERICDAIGGYLASAILAGYIRLQVPR